MRLENLEGIATSIEFRANRDGHVIASFLFEQVHAGRRTWWQASFESPEGRVPLLIEGDRLIVNAWCPGIFRAAMEGDCDGTQLYIEEFENCTRRQHHRAYSHSEASE